jgi:hypothetical protein
MHCPKEIKQNNKITRLNTIMIQDSSSNLSRLIQHSHILSCIFRKTSFLIIPLIFSLTIVSNIQGQKAKIACVGFYNLENLFDTEDDPSIADEEFTPTGPKAWTPDKYQDKLLRLSEVIVRLGTDLNPDGVGILGVCEVENRRVLQDLVSTPNLKDRNYQILHFNSFDPRGIDLAILYQNKYFTPLEAQMVEIPLKDSDGNYRKTRGLLIAKGKIENQIVYILVNHWPSKRGGELATSSLRIQASKKNKEIADSIQILNPDANIIIMGDLNDNPNSTSVAKYLRAEKETRSLKSGSFYNPFYKNYLLGEGTTAHDDSWSLFDQILLSKNCLGKSNVQYKFLKHKIFHESFMIQEDGHYKNYPRRTFSGDVYNFGYSDHFPVVVYFAKMVKE